MIAASSFPAYLAAVGAFLAAGLGVWNVVLSSRLSQRTELHRWRRETLLPTLVKFLEAADAVLDTCSVIADIDYAPTDPTYRDRVRSIFQQASKDIQWSKAQVDLIAPPEVAARATELRRSLSGLEAATNLTLHLIEKGALEWRDPDEAKYEEAARLREAFLAAARASVGIPKGA